MTKSGLQRFNDLLEAVAVAVVVGNNGWWRGGELVKYQFPLLGLLVDADAVVCKNSIRAADVTNCGNSIDFQFSGADAPLRRASSSRHQRLWRLFE